MARISRSDPNETPTSHGPRKVPGGPLSTPPGPANGLALLGVSAPQSMRRRHDAGQHRLKGNRPAACGGGDPCGGGGGAVGVVRGAGRRAAVAADDPRHDLIGGRQRGQVAGRALGGAALWRYLTPRSGAVAAGGEAVRVREEGIPADGAPGLPEDGGGGGRFAMGGRARLSGLTGAAYTVEVRPPLGRGLRGELGKHRVWRQRCAAIDHDVRGVGAERVVERPVAVQAGDPASHEEGEREPGRSGVDVHRGATREIDRREAGGDPATGLGRRAVEVVQADVLRFIDDLGAGMVTGIHQVAGDFGLAVNDHVLARVTVHVDAVPLTTEQQLEAAMHQALAVHALAHAGFVHQVNADLLQDAGADAAQNLSLIHISEPTRPY